MPAADGHPPLSRPGEWWACEHPERPPDGFWTVYYAGECRACRIALQAAIANLTADGR